VKHRQRIQLPYYSLRGQRKNCCNFPPFLRNRNSIHPLSCHLQPEGPGVGLGVGVGVGVGFTVGVAVGVGMAYDPFRLPRANAHGKAMRLEYIAHRLIPDKSLQNRTEKKECCLGQLRRIF
jgi:hypothetical protein